MRFIVYGFGGSKSVTRQPAHTRGSLKAQTARPDTHSAQPRAATNKTTPGARGHGDHKPPVRHHQHVNTTHEHQQNQAAETRSTPHHGTQRLSQPPNDPQKGRVRNTARTVHSQSWPTAGIPAEAPAQRHRRPMRHLTTTPAQNTSPRTGTRAPTKPKEQPRAHQPRHHSPPVHTAKTSRPPGEEAMKGAPMAAASRR